MSFFDFALSKSYFSPELILLKQPDILAG